jgi:subtilase family serine protease
MKSTKTSILLLLTVLLASTATVPAFSSVVFNSGSQGLQFVPMVRMAPENVTVTAAGTFSCITPTPPRVFHCYTPSLVRTAYNVDPLYASGIDGRGETIVIVDAYGSPTALADLQHFSTTFGLPVPNMPGGPTFQIIYPSGTPTFNPSMHGVQVGWAEETSLDLQWAHAIAPMANIVLVAANPAETEGVQGFPSIFMGEQYAIQHYPGSVISQSFAVTEQSFKGAANAQVAKFDQTYQQAVAKYVTVLGSAGDSGTANVIGGQGSSTPKVLPFPTVNWPSSDPLVTSAGGTWLQYGWTWNPSLPTDMSFTTTPGSRTEAVWNEPFIQAATGGGLSTLFSTPSFQGGISQSVLNGARGLPDLSWNSAVDGGVLVYLGFLGPASGFYIFGGTSAASPQLAGLIALTNQLADSMGKAHHVGYLNPLLYTLPASDFMDTVPQTFGAVTISDNSLFGSGIPGYHATAGWDLATGFGSPNAFNFVTDLANALP